VYSTSGKFNRPTAKDSVRKARIQQAPFPALPFGQHPLIEYGEVYLQA
jgi:hypothetical protein